jgi:hypothetical protein
MLAGLTASSATGRVSRAAIGANRHCFCSSTPTLSLTDSAAIYLAGQLGHAVNGGTFRFNRFLMQRCPTGGEYTGANFTVNDSAFIECPDDSANFVNGDNDALYFVSGNYSFTNTLIGWTKDDGIDSGGSGYGPLNYQSCWFESIFHEGNSLSGYKNVYARDTVYLDCGQGIEDGYNAPTGRVDHCLFVANQVGVRHGDNYDNNGNYGGRLTATNCLILNNHRDVFGYNWHINGGWTNASGQMFIDNNLLTVPDTNFPNNAVWNPVADAWRLGAFGARGHVAVAFAMHPSQTTPTSLPDGLPVALSTFCTNEVAVDYDLDATDGTKLAGTLRFVPGRCASSFPSQRMRACCEPRSRIRRMPTSPARARFSSKICLRQRQRWWPGAPSGNTSIPPRTSPQVGRPPTSMIPSGPADWERSVTATAQKELCCDPPRLRRIR